MPPSGSHRELRFDDVVSAYRWILGREPESTAIIAEQALAGGDIERLRAMLLESPEFRSAFLNLDTGKSFALADSAHQQSLGDRFVFLHIPRSGGTSLHHMLSAAVGARNVCEARHNNLWRCLAGDLAPLRLFSGHYDRHCLALIPGRQIKVVTVLREPRSRLVSLYDYLRSHRPETAAPGKLELAEAARKYSLGDFLDAAMEINPAAVDNTCLRAFGGRLPLRRWEQSAEPGAPKALADQGCSVETLYQRAEEFLRGMTAVGILEQFEASARAIFAALGLDAPPPSPALHRLVDVAEENPTFEPVQPSSVTPADAERLAALTQYDAQLYEMGKALLSASLQTRAD